MTERTDGEILTAMGTDAAKWTDEFMRVQAERKSALSDWGVMVSWFASAIEAGRALGRREMCPHTNHTDLSSAKSAPLVVCLDCGAGHDTLSDTWA